MVDMHFILLLQKGKIRCSSTTEQVKLDIDVKDNSFRCVLVVVGVGRWWWWWPAILVVCVGCFWWNGGGGLTILLIAYLLEIGANPEIPNDTDMMHMNLLHHASMKGHNGVISLLLSKGISIDVSNGFGSPLQLACVFGQHDTVKLLLDHPSQSQFVFHEVATSVIHPFQNLAMRGEFTQGADPNGGSDGVKALPLAAKVGVIQIIELSVEAGAGPNFTDMGSYLLKPIEEAAIDGNRQGVEIHFPEHMWT
ncbi:hypothetical protein C5167_035040 [Papaver somniferum]|uniref:Uncharacterized protein n=1 Tax=Papaver somniferum TaxID=3469 RepID=A0A4Y7KIA0_PAPSO|nr:hypothetical protein C5167_035040 [Papaver somniferum]